MRIVAFDSRRVLRKKPQVIIKEQNLEQVKLDEVLQPDFKALLGIGVTITDYKMFASEYNKVMDECFKSNGFSRSRTIYKGSDLLSIFHGAGIDIIPLVAEKLIPHIGFIDIYYSYFVPQSNSEKTQLIGIYWEEQLERKTPVEFLDLVEGPYPALCCYAFINSLHSKVEQTYLMDHCPGLRPSEAIKSVIRTDSTRFIFKGDQANYAISAADIICKYIDIQCLKNGFYLNKDMVQKLNFDEKKFQTTFIGPSWLRQIKPSRNILLDVSHKYPHPIFFFFPDSQGPFSNKSKDVLEESQLFSMALDKSCELGGCVKFFEPIDQKYITEDDFLVEHSKLSLEKIDELKKLACPAQKIDSIFFKK